MDRFTSCASACHAEACGDKPSAPGSAEPIPVAPRPRARDDPSPWHPALARGQPRDARPRPPAPLPPRKKARRRSGRRRVWIWVRPPLGRGVRRALSIERPKAKEKGGDVYRPNSLSIGGSHRLWPGAARIAAAVPPAPPLGGFRRRRSSQARGRFRGAAPDASPPPGLHLRHRPALLAHARTAIARHNRRPPMLRLRSHRHHRRQRRPRYRSQMLVPGMRARMTLRIWWEPPICTAGSFIT